MLLETKAIPTYSVWARFIVKRKKRKTWLTVFKYYLLFSLFIAAPILLYLGEHRLRRQAPEDAGGDAVPPASGSAPGGALPAGQ